MGFEGFQQGPVGLTTRVKLRGEVVHPSIGRIVRLTISITSPFGLSTVQIRLWYNQEVSLFKQACR